MFVDWILIRFVVQKLILLMFKKSQNRIESLCVRVSFSVVIFSFKSKSRLQSFRCVQVKSKQPTIFGMVYFANSCSFPYSIGIVAFFFLSLNGMMYTQTINMFYIYVVIERLLVQRMNERKTDEYSFVDWSMEKNWKLSEKGKVKRVKKSDRTMVEIGIEIKWSLLTTANKQTNI